MQVFLRALGCRLNEAELQTWGQQFIDGGFQLSTSALDADLLVLNTCAVTAEAARKSKQILRRMHRDNPTARLVVTGCYASLDESEASEILGVDLVVPNSQKDQLVGIAIEQFFHEDELLQTMPAFATEPGESALYLRNRDRAFIKIQDGCRYKCSYCIVTKARGSEVSRTIADIVGQVNQYVEEGIHEIVLTGVHVGGYGSDINETLYDLVSAILNDTDIPRVRFASVEPWDLPDQFFALFKNKRLMPHMHLPLQAGSDTVLRRMSRRCNKQSFRDLVAHARSSIANFNVTTDIIVGFPGETDEEFEESLDFIEEIGFGHIHIFSYSHRDGTRAAKLPGVLTNAIKKQRSKRLQILAAKLKQQAQQEMLGQTVDVLWESGYKVPMIGVGQEDNSVIFSGYTPNYHRITTQMPEDASGLIIPTTVNALSDESQGLNRHLCGNINSSNLGKLSSLISVKQI